MYIIFNVADLNPFDVGDDFSDSRTNPFEEGEDDKHHGVPKVPIELITRSKAKTTSIHYSFIKLYRLGSIIISCVTS